MRVTITLIACFMTTLGWSQGGTEEKADSTRISLGNDSEIILINSNKKRNKNDSIQIRENDEDAEYDMGDFTYWSGIDVAFTGLIMPTETEEAYPWLDINEAKSVAISFNVYETKIPLIKHYLGINTGLGFTYQDFVLSDTLSLMNIQGDSISGVSTLPLGFKYDKNKLKTGYIRIPLLVEINTSRTPEKNFHIAAGLIGGWNFRSILKQEFELERDKTKTKTRGDYNLNPWSIEATARVGYGDFTLIASTNLTGLFEEDKGPEVYPFTVGLGLSF